MVRLNQISARFAAAGLRLGYHEHEFQLRYGGERVFDILFANLSPEILMELDTGNAIAGGADPVEVIGRYPQRPLLLHCKPCGAAGFDVDLGGPGDLNDWPAILAAGRQTGQWLIVESESRLRTGLENARAGIEGLKRCS